MDAPVFHKPIESVFRIKAITVYQVWAMLILWKLKRWETRSWRPQMRLGDLLLIHAGKKFGGAERQYLMQEPYKTALVKYGITDARAQLPFGAALCIAKLVSVRRVEDIRDNLTWMERSFGNYADGRFGWELEIVHVFEKPIPMQGAQGIFTVEFPRNPMLPKLEVLTGGKVSTDYQKKEVELQKFDDARYGMLRKYHPQRDEYERLSPVMWKHKLLPRQIADLEKRIEVGDTGGRDIQDLRRLLWADRERLKEGEEAIQKGMMRA
jgi:hypothetical protein